MRSRDVRSNELGRIPPSVSRNIACKRDRSRFLQLYRKHSADARRMHYKRRMQTRLIGYAFRTECRHVALVGALALVAFWIPPLRHRYFMKGLVSVALFLRFRVSAFILGYRMRARARFLPHPGFIISRRAGIYLAGGGARVTFVICGVFGRSECAKGGLSRGYLRVIIMNFSSKRLRAAGPAEDEAVTARCKNSRARARVRQRERV